MLKSMLREVVSPVTWAELASLGLLVAMVFFVSAIASGA